MRKVMTILLVMLLCLTMLTPAVLAAENPSVELQVSITLEGTLPESADSFVVVLTANDATFPMPAGSENGVYTAAIKGADSVVFPAITYTQVGVYTYTVTQQAGSADCAYDSSVYTMTVYVTNAENGDGLEATTVLYRNNETEKCNNVTFNNIYETVNPSSPATPNTPSTGDSSRATLYTALLIGSALLILVLLVACFRKKRAKGNG